LRNKIKKNITKKYIKYYILLNYKMKIIIDTSKDSKSDIRGIIFFLNSYLNSESQTSPESDIKPKTSNIETYDLGGMNDMVTENKDITGENKPDLNSTHKKDDFDNQKRNKSSDFMDMSIVNHILEGNGYKKEDFDNDKNKKEKVYSSEKIEIIPF
jgi:hypothetical protein